MSFGFHLFDCESKKQRTINRPDRVFSFFPFFSPSSNSVMYRAGNDSFFLSFSAGENGNRSKLAFTEEVMAAVKRAITTGAAKTFFFSSFISGREVSRTFTLLIKVRTHTHRKRERRCAKNSCADIHDQVHQRGRDVLQKNKSWGKMA